MEEEVHYFSPLPMGKRLENSILNIDRSSFKRGRSYFFEIGNQKSEVWYYFSDFWPLTSDFNKFREVFCIKQELPINEQIRNKEVQVIDEQGNKLGVMNTFDAIDMAVDKKMDLVLVAPNTTPPVCKIMNYGKYKFEQAKREKEARKNQKVSETKEIRITPNIEDHDFGFKCKNARKFLEDGNKVKITVRFRGRELNYVKLGEENLNKFIEELADISQVEKRPVLEGKNLFIVLSKKV